MKRMVTEVFAPLSLCAFAIAGCSQDTEDNAQLAAERASEDTKANLDVAGEVIEEGAIDAADAVAEGAGRLADDLRDGDEEEPGPAPVTGDNLSE